MIRTESTDVKENLSYTIQFIQWVTDDQVSRTKEIALAIFAVAAYILSANFLISYVTSSFALQAVLGIGAILLPILGFFHCLVEATRLDNMIKAEERSVKSAKVTAELKEKFEHIKQILNVRGFTYETLPKCVWLPKEYEMTHRSMDDHRIMSGTNVSGISYIALKIQDKKPYYRNDSNRVLLLYLGTEGSGAFGMRLAGHTPIQDDFNHLQTKDVEAQLTQILDGRHPRFSLT